MNNQTRTMRGVVSWAVAGWLLAGCASKLDPGELGELEENALTCRGTPHPTSCQEAICDPGTKSWEIDPLPAGTGCERTGTCDGDGHCILPPPSRPTAVTVTAKHISTMSLSWNAAAGATSYSVAISPVPAGCPPTLSSTSTSVTWTPLASSSQYCFTVTASNGSGSTSSAPVCAYTSTPVYLTDTFNAGLPPMAGVPPILPARVESITLPSSSDFGPNSFVGLLPPISKDSDCGNAALLRPGDTTLHSAIQFIYGTEHPIMGTLINACPLGGAKGLTQVLLEFNFTPSPTMHITDATFGGNVGAPLGNITADVRSMGLISVIPAAGGGCEGAVACNYTVSSARTGDPVPGQAKDFVAHFICGSDPTVHVASAPAEADGTDVHLECSPIYVQDASYGLNTSESLEGNATTDVRSSCDGNLECAYTVSVSRLGDPAPGIEKNFVVSWLCGSDLTLHSFTAPPEANNSVVPLVCP